MCLILAAMYLIKNNKTTQLMGHYALLLLLLLNYGLKQKIIVLHQKVKKSEPNVSCLHCCSTLPVFFMMHLLLLYYQPGTWNRSTLLDTVSLKAFRMLLLVAQRTSDGRIKNYKE